MTVKDMHRLLATKHSRGLIICAICGMPIQPYHKLTIDHWLPKSKFPAFAKNAKNLIPAHKICNEIKADLTPDDFEECKEERFAYALEHWKLKYQDRRIIKQALHNFARQRK